VIGPRNPVFHGADRQHGPCGTRSGDETALVSRDRILRDLGYLLPFVANETAVAISA
jgi:hypothetical protein